MYTAIEKPAAQRAQIHAQGTVLGNKHQESSECRRTQKRAGEDTYECCKQHNEDPNEKTDDNCDDDHRGSVHSALQPARLLSVCLFDLTFLTEPEKQRKKFSSRGCFKGIHDLFSSAGAACN